MRFAFLIWGDFSSQRDRVLFPDGQTEMIGVSSLEEACTVARSLQEQGVDCIELCGAFEETGARQVIQATGGKLPVGFVTHLAEQDGLFTALFG